MKYIAVDKCRECEWYTTDPIGNYYCHTAQKVPKNDAVIPPWCPLPDLPEVDKPKCTDCDWWDDKCIRSSPTDCVDYGLFDPIPKDNPEADTPENDETKTNKAYQKWIGKSEEPHKEEDKCPECVDTDCETCPGTGKRDDNPTKQEG